MASATDANPRGQGCRCALVMHVHGVRTVRSGHDIAPRVQRGGDPCFSTGGSKGASRLSSAAAGSGARRGLAACEPLDRAAPASLLPHLDAPAVQDLIDRGVIDAGMIPKVE